MCYRLILYQAFIQTYPTMATYYLALAYNQASGQARTRIMGGQGTMSRAHRANTSTTTMNSPPPAPRMLDDHELPRPPIVRNERGLGSTWSGKS